jgi:hypothetical protein
MSYFFMAPPVLALLGNTSFLALYLGSGVFASVASLAWRHLRGGNSTDSSHGASGPFSVPPPRNPLNLSPLFQPRSMLSSPSLRACNPPPRSSSLALFLVQLGLGYPASSFLTAILLSRIRSVREQ